jgi:F-type H+-transporting ATPase subunit delta
MIEIARQYALALFSLAKAEQKSEEIPALFQRHKELQAETTLKLFLSPRISKADKRDIVSQSVSDMLFRHFLFVLIDNDRLKLLALIEAEYNALIRDQNQEMEVSVFCKRPLSPSTKDRLKRKLEQDYDKRVSIKEIIDPTIIAGIRIEFAGKVIDETINRQIINLTHNLKQ